MNDSITVEMVGYESTTIQLGSTIQSVISNLTSDITITETNTGTELSRVVIVENEATNIKDALLILFDGDAENGNYDTLQLMIHAIQSNITSYSIEGMVSRIMYTQSVIQVLTADDP
jgi:hypothetical protein